MLLDREQASVEDAVERLAGLQAQEPRPPYVGLWSRLAGFERTQLEAALESRRIVRASFYRGTLHLVTGQDYVRFRSAIAPALEAALAVLRSRAEGIDPPRLLAAARKIFDDAPRTFTELRGEVSKAFPEIADARAMGYTVRMLLPLIAVPDRSKWGSPSDPTFTRAESWLGEALDPKADIEALVLRYLAAFGPATAADMQTWSGLKGLKPTFETLRPRLLALRDERGRELFDLPDAPRPHEDAPAPVRFIADYDNLVLAHADRRRIIAAEHRPRVVSRNLRVAATFLVDGFVAGVWRVERKKKTATLTASPFVGLSSKQKKELEREAGPLLSFLETDAEKREIQFDAPPRL